MDKNRPITRRHNIVTWSLITGLLVLRLPVLTGVILATSQEPVWLEPVYQIGTFLLTAVLIWWERTRLARFHIDPIVIAIILLFKPIQTLILPVWGDLSALAFPNPLSFSFLIVSAGLLIALWRSHYCFNQNLIKSLLWLLIGAIGGVLLNLLVTIIDIKLLAYPVPPPVGPEALLSPIYQLGYAAVDEEPLFRGFLWGALKRSGVKDIWILFIQAIIFTAGHSYLLGTSNALISLIYVFVFSLIAGLLVWKSRTIASSMGFHAFWNGSAFFVYTALSIFLK